MSPYLSFLCPGNLTSVAHSNKLLCCLEFWLPFVNQKPWQRAQRMGKEAWLGWLSHVRTLQTSFTCHSFSTKEWPLLAQFQAYELEGTPHRRGFWLSLGLSPLAWLPHPFFEILPIINFPAIQPLTVLLPAGTIASTENQRSSVLG